MVRISRRIGIIFLLLAWVPFTAQAGRAASGLGTFAMVQPVLQLSVLSQPSTLTIRTEDIARGYIDVDSATVLQVRTNSREGYLLAFENREPLITAIIVKDGERTTNLSPEGGMVYYASSDTSSGRTRVLSYRLFLSEQTAVGSYAWPLQLDALLD